MNFRSVLKSDMAKKWKKIIRNLRLELALPLLKVFGHLPPRFGFWLGYKIGGSFCYFNTQERNRALAHLDLAMGDKLTPWQRERISQKVFANFGGVVGELATLLSRSQDYRMKRIYCSPENRAKFEKCLEKGKGVIIMTMHMGSFELLAAWMKVNFDGIGIGKKMKEKKADLFLTHCRTKMGYEIMPQDSNLRDFLAPLKKNKILGMVPDQDLKKTAGIFVPFFGTEAWTITGPAVLSLLSGAPMLPVVLIPENGRYQVHTGQPIFPERSKNKSEDVKRLTVSWSRALEELITRFPEHWAWFHRRWKTRPEGEGAVVTYGAPGRLPGTLKTSSSTDIKVKSWQSKT